MAQKTYNKLKKLQSVGLFDYNKAKALSSISQPTLYRYAQKGLIRNVSHGVYVHSQSSIPQEYLDFAIACFRFGPRSAVGGLSALYYYGLIEQAPQQVWIIVPSTKKDESVHSKYKCLRTHYSLKIGIDKKKYFRITNIERTLIESMKFSKKIGQRTVISAVRKALKERMTTEKKIGIISSQLKMKKFLEKYWEAILA